MTDKKYTEKYIPLKTFCLHDKGFKYYNFHNTNDSSVDNSILNESSYNKLKELSYNKLKEPSYNKLKEINSTQRLINFDNLDEFYDTYTYLSILDNIQIFPSLKKNFFTNFM